MQNFTEWLQSKDKSPNTIRRYLIVLTQFENWLRQTYGNSLDLKDVSSLEIREWKDYLQNEKRSKKGKRLSPSTISNSLESLKTFYKYLQDNGQISNNPVEDIKAPKIQEIRQPKWLQRKDKNALLRYIENEELKKKNMWKYYRNLAIVHIMLQAGLRVSEVVELELQDIQDGIIFIRDSKDGKSRIVPINKDLSVMLNNWIKVRELKKNTHSEKLFISQKGGPLTISGINHLFDAIRKKTHISYLTPHVLRHTFCHDLATAKTRIDIIAKLAGHSDLDTTRIYISAAKYEMENAVE